MAGGQILLKIYAPDDLSTPLCELTDDDIQAGDILRAAENELGMGQFKIHRSHVLATEANLAGGNYVKVYLSEWRTDVPVFGWWIRDDDDTVISKDEEGGEFLTRSGPGALAILGNAALLNTFYNGSLGGMARGNYSEPGYWTWATEPYGAILVRLLEEGQLEPGTPLDQVTWDFVRTLDSNGDAWPDIQELIQFSIGTDGLTVYQRLIESGHLFVYPDYDTLEIHAYGTSQGTDRSSGTFASGKIRFEKGVNIATELAKQSDDMPVATHALVVGKNGIYRQVVAPGYTSGPGRWVTVDYPESNDPDLLDGVGAHELFHRNAMQQAIEFEILPGIDDTLGRYLPFQFFNPGDLATLHTGTDPWDYDEVTMPIAGIRIVLKEAATGVDADPTARSISVIVELNRGSTSDGLGAAGGIDHGLGDCPFFVQAGSDSGLRMRMRDYGGDGAYTEIGAAHGVDSDADSYIRLKAAAGGGAGNVGIDIFSYDNNTGDYAELILGFGGDVFTLAGGGGVWEADIDGDHNNAKHFFLGGWGIVLPGDLPDGTDPVTLASQAGQVYYNVVSNKIRWYNGTVWQDVASPTGGAITPVIAYAESTSPGTTSGTPATQTNVPFGAFYNVSQGSIGSLPAAIGLTYASGVFTATEDGVWVLNLGVTVAAAPGSTGDLLLDVPNYGFSPSLVIAAAGNATTWEVERTVVMKAGDTFSLKQRSAGASVTLINAYAEIDIVRIANAVS